MSIEQDAASDGKKTLALVASPYSLLPARVMWAGDGCTSPPSPSRSTT